MIKSIVAAMDANQLIGHNNQLPWHLPADLKHFKQVTMGKPILMGRNTYESIGRPLPGRHNVVISRNPALKIEGCSVCASIDAAFELCADDAEVCLIGGASLYQQVLGLADRLYLTRIDAEFEGDAWFPEIDLSQWRKTEERLMPVDDKNAWPYRFCTFERKAAG